MLFIFSTKICKNSQNSYNGCNYFITLRGMLVKTMTALDAKNSFGVFLDTVRREPVTVTKNSREVAAMFSMEDLQDLANAFLAEPIKQDVENGTLGVPEALMVQMKINKRLEEGRLAIEQGQGIEVNDAYFENLQARAIARRS